MKQWVVLLGGWLSLSSAWGQVLLGVDVLEKDNFKQLQGKTVGLITNHTGQNSRGITTIDLLFHAPDVRLLRLFSPEHGIRGDAPHGLIIGHETDPATQLPVWSLYGASQRPTDEMLSGLDVLVFDIQDIGTRFYTYTTTLAYALEAAAAHGMEFVVLDRPNPLTGTIVEGPALDPAIQHFTAYLTVPVRHGMTVGELAQWHNTTKNLNAKLTVIKMEGWRRGMWWEDTKLPWRSTSPNIRSVRAATLYPGVGSFEATNVSVGRGTATPFEVFGAPWVNGRTLARRLNKLKLPGFTFRATRFTPRTDRYKGEQCRGVKVTLTNRDAARPLDLFLQAYGILRELYPQDFAPRWPDMERVAGSGKMNDWLKQNLTPLQMTEQMSQAVDHFLQARRLSLLYID